MVVYSVTQTVSTSSSPLGSGAADSATAVDHVNAVMSPEDTAPGIGYVESGLIVASCDDMALVATSSEGAVTIALDSGVLHAIILDSVVANVSELYREFDSRVDASRVGEYPVGCKVVLFGQRTLMLDNVGMSRALAPDGAETFKPDLWGTMTFVTFPSFLHFS